MGTILTIAGLVLTLVLAIIGGLCAIIMALLKRNADGTTQRSEKTQDKQVSQGEVMAGVLARVSSLEDGHSKIADALDRLTRLEEFRLHAIPKLDEAEETARAQIAFGEQMKTVFKRIDGMSEQMNKQSEKIDNIPGAVVAELRTLTQRRIA